MSEVKVNKISPRTNCGTVTLGDSGDTFTIPSGATITNSGTATGFGRTGTVDWQTDSIKTATFTATSGEGYFVNTTAGVITVNLPAGVAGDIVGLKDYANTWDSYAVTLNPNGSDNIGGGSAIDPTLSSEGGAVLLVYVDGTQGWLPTQQSVTASPSGVENFIVATGGTPCAGEISGDYKYHTFTGPGTFTVSSLSTCAANDVVSYIVVAGGSGGGNGGTGSGGGGAGGFREGKNPADPYTASPLAAACSEIPVSATGYPIVVGGGGAGVATPNVGGAGSVSSGLGISSAAGGVGGKWNSGGQTAGGSGGGSAQPGGTGGAGDTPNVTPDQGFPGGDGGWNTMAGGGGATAKGGDGNPSAPERIGGCGGAGATTSITGSPLAYAGGGGGGFAAAGPVPAGGAPGGSSVGGNGAGGCAGSGATAGTTNRGGGGGGAGGPNAIASGAGGSGVVIIRYKFQ